MFEAALNLITDFASIYPFIICLILIFNIVSDLLWRD